MIVRKTKIFRLKNFRFKKNRKILNHNSKELCEADLVIIEFEFQKNNVRNRSVRTYVEYQRQIIMSGKSVGAYNTEYAYDSTGHNE